MLGIFSVVIPQAVAGQSGARKSASALPVRRQSAPATPRLGTGDAQTVGDRFFTGIALGAVTADRRVGVRGRQRSPLTPLL